MDGSRGGDGVRAPRPALLIAEISFYFIYGPRPAAPGFPELLIRPPGRGLRGSRADMIVGAPFTLGQIFIERERAAGAQRIL